MHEFLKFWEYGIYPDFLQFTDLQKNTRSEIKIQNIQNIGSKFISLQFNKW